MMYWMRHPFNKRFMLASIVSVFMASFIFGTNPNSLPLPLIMGPFILLFVFLYLAVRMILDRLTPNLPTGAGKSLSVMLAALPVLLLTLQSISQLTSRDLLITGGLIVLLLFYFRKIDFLV